MAQAEEQIGEDASDSEAEMALPDRLHRTIGGGVREIADRIDRFFVDEHLEDEFQTSSIRVKPTVAWYESGDVDFEVPLKVRLVLPRLQRKWQFFVDSILDEDNDLDPDRIDTTRDETLPTVDAETSSTLGLQFIPFAKIRKNIRFRSGLKVRDWEIIPFVSTRYRHESVFKIWKARWTQKVFWFEDNGFGERTDMVWERNLGNQIQFRSTSSATWSETSEGVDLKELLVLRRFLREDRAVSLSYLITGHTRPEAIVDAHTLAVKYRQRFLRKWLFFEIEPQFRFLEEDDFELSPVLFVSNEVVF